MDLFELTKSLVNMASVTGHERACAEFVRGYLAQLGFQTELMPVSRDRSNVFATWGKPDIVMSTHMDTVPPFFPANEDADFIYGRGSCDAKGILASQVSAAERLKKDGVEDFALLFLVGEETTSDGAREANLHPRGSRYIINGEPTENKLVIGTKGNLRVDIRAHGKMAHSAYPHLGVNAIEKLLDVLADVRRIPLPNSTMLGPSTMNIGMITGGRAANVVPDEAVAQILIRIVENSEPLRQKFVEAIGDRCELEVVRDTPPLLMEKLEGYETDVVAFTTDLPSLTHWGRPLLLGPGSISTAHTDRECVRKADLSAAADLYYRMVRDLKKQNAVSHQ
ncbi:MAG: M20/M25/M40 family metallo-hydrolase [Acidobacteriota bacterium]|nr:M20/M25/M40 family metallo-hydrolase [Acidobacteriota bacterium]